MTHRITISEITGGQKRPYADSEYSGHLLIEWQGIEGYKEPNAPLKPWAELNEVIVRKYAQLIHPFKVNPEWHEPRLTLLQNTGPGEWDVVIKQPYLD